MINIRSESPQAYTSSERSGFCRLIEQGGEVSMKGLESRVDNAEKLITAWFEGNMVGVGAIKKPLLSYQRRIFSSAEVAVEASDQFREIGWLFVKPEQQGKGIGKQIMESIRQSLTAAPCFATTRTDNAVMHYLLPQYGLHRSGIDYPSKSGDYSLMLFLKCD